MDPRPAQKQAFGDDIVKGAKNQHRLLSLDSYPLKQTGAVQAAILEK